MILVVRTDLGMTKGMSVLCIGYKLPLMRSRQDWRTMRARDTGLLQALPATFAQLDDTTAMGTVRPGKGSIAGQGRGGAGAATGTSIESWTCGAHHTRCRTDSDCQWECNGAGNRTCAQGSDRSGHRAFEAAVACTLQFRTWFKQLENVRQPETLQAQQTISPKQ